MPTRSGNKKKSGGSNNQQSGNRHSTFDDVSNEEVTQMIEALSKDFDTNEVQKVSKKWMKAVMSQPYNKGNKLCRRPFEYSKQKLSNYLTWREKFEITRKIDMHLSYHERKMMNDKETACNTNTSCSSPTTTTTTTIGVETKEQEGDILAITVSPGSLYWYGTDKEGSPILWYRADRTVFEKCKVKNEMECTSVVIQAALDRMPENIHDFNFIVLFDVYDPLKAMTKPNLAPAFIKTFTTISPDRLKRAYMVTGTLGHVFYKVAKRIAPGSIMDKVIETRSREDTAKLLVKEGVIDDESKIPNFLGGTFLHDDKIITNYFRMMKEITNVMHKKNDHDTSKE